MSSLFKICKEDKGARAIFIIFAIMILLGIACFIFALVRPVQ